MQTEVQKNEELEELERKRKEKEQSERDRDTKTHEDWFKLMDDILCAAGRAKEQLREVAGGLPGPDSPLHLYTLNCYSRSRPYMMAQLGSRFCTLKITLPPTDREQDPKAS